MCCGGFNISNKVKLFSWFVAYCLYIISFVTGSKFSLQLFNIRPTPNQAILENGEISWVKYFKIKLKELVYSRVVIVL